MRPCFCSATSCDVLAFRDTSWHPSLVATSAKGDGTVLLVAGEQLIGAKQNRVLNASIMVDGNCELSVPVSCVEAGRWGYRSREFRSRGSSSHGYLRRKMSRGAYDAYRVTGRPSSKQGEVWAEIGRKMGSMGTESPSSALEQVYEDYEERLNGMLREVRAPERCGGVAFAFGGTVAGMDLFDRPETLKRLFPKLVRAWAPALVIWPTMRRPFRCGWPTSRSSWASSVSPRTWDVPRMYI